jgi:glycosyltransferase involved in cell wall biosynthesis
VHPDRLDVVMALTYYAPYVSGLTQAAQWVAEELVVRGHRVHVVTTHHDEATPLTEAVGGVEVQRVPVALRVGKGALAPGFSRSVRAAARSADVVNLHLPMLEAGLVAGLTGRVPVVSTYQCDVNLSDSLVDRLQVAALDASSRRALRRSVPVFSSRDYAASSRVAGAAADVVEVPPPCKARTGGRPSFRDGPGRHVGFLGRLVAEKGVEHLVDAFRQAAGPEDRLLIGGDHTRVAGGSVVDEIRRRAGDDPRIRLLGFLPDEQLADFYASLDVFVLPSVNSLEAFGIVQVEAMLTGVPVIASDLPGVREPVRRTGFGIVVPPGRRDALAEALGARVPLAPDEGARRAAATYGLSATVDAYEALFSRVARHGGA